VHGNRHATSSNLDRLDKESAVPVVRVGATSELAEVCDAVVVGVGHRVGCVSGIQLVRQLPCVVHAVGVASDLEISLFQPAVGLFYEGVCAVRITHLPTGLVVSCQDEKSQLQNRIKAMSILRARLYDMEVQRQQAELGAERRSQLGGGDRSEKIRTYNFPQNRVTDHRIGKSSYNLPAVLDGELDDFIDELSLAEQTEKLQSE